jgi:hypothetical protein
MRHTIVVLTLVSCAMALSACGGGNSGPSADWQDGTHNVRTYYPMSMPAFLPDGGKFVANGAQLLKFSAGDALLDTIALPISEQQQSSLHPRVISTAAGSVFVLLGDGRIGRVNAAGQFEWLQDFNAPPDGAQAFGDGLLAYSHADDGNKYILLDRFGTVNFSMPVTRYPPVIDSTGPDAHAFFVSGQNLSVVDATGAWELQDSPLDDIQAQRPISAAAGRVLLSNAATTGSLYCYDLSGDMLWSAELPEGYLAASSGLLFEDGTATVPIVNSSSHEYSIMRYAADGAPQQRQLGLYLQRTARMDSARFAALYTSGDGQCYGLFTNAGELLWGVERPAASHLGGYQPWEDAVSYSNVTDCFCGPDQRVYFEWESTLIALDAQGNQAWRQAGHEYLDKQAPNLGPGHTTNPGGTGGQTKPASKF